MADPVNIELGEGLLTLKSSGDVTPIDVGYSSGANFSYTPSYKDIESGIAFSAVKSVMIGEEGVFKIKLQESTMRNLVIAMGLSPSTISSSASSDVIVFGGSAKARVYYLLNYKVAQIDTPAKFYEFVGFKAAAVSGLALNFSRTDERAFEITFKLFPDATQNNILGKIVKDR